MTRDQSGENLDLGGENEMTSHTVFNCPFCKGILVPPGGTNEARIADDLNWEELYCPSCEMLVDPIASTANEENTLDVNKMPQNPGRSRQSGSNAGGSQRGDDSDEGASQWLSDPKEIERNSWSDKD